MLSSGRVLSALPQGGRPAQRTDPMLDLEVVPERSLGNEQWEFTLGECGVFWDPVGWPLILPSPFRFWFLPQMPLRPRFFAFSHPLVFRLRALESRSSRLS